MPGLKIPPIDPLRCLLFKNLKEKNLTGGNRGNGGALRRWLMLDSLEGLSGANGRLEKPSNEPALRCV
jgi:hypothetical protein